MNKLTWAKRNPERSREIKRRWMKKHPEQMQACRDIWKNNNRARILQKRRERTERLTGRKVIPRGSMILSREERRARRKATVRKYWETHKDEIKRKPYYGKTVGKKTLTREQYKKKLEWQKVWRKKNPEKMRAYSLKSRDNPQRIIKQRLASRINNALKRRGLRKSAKTSELVGCTWAFLRSYIENKFTAGMSWENRSRWHIDHIKPCAKFDLTDPSQQRICFHYSNLQPLWGPENCSKWCKWEEAA